MQNHQHIGSICTFGQYLYSCHLYNKEKEEDQIHCLGALHKIFHRVLSMCHWYGRSGPDPIFTKFWKFILKVSVLKSLEMNFPSTGRYGHFSNQYIIIHGEKRKKNVSHLQATWENNVYVPLKSIPRFKHHLFMSSISRYPRKNLKSKILAYSDFALASCAQ